MRGNRGSLAVADLTFEQALKRFEEIVEALETEDLDLEKSLQFYEEGVGLYRYCNQQLQAAEKRIDLLQTRADGTLTAEPFVLRDETSNTNGETHSTS
ncbi:MAG: exodeoxyribonuclease VII small subunit [Candidatus Tectomicrobia bacterium]|uniref:Exodeoxyribonuclease 7 small subunit n=1 Tax=Tectimicrobiota bacterium TaxID=2528274 RepID=A0A937W054_UNCTE|nr:exodeoxyribonuclease VII small subunit [Candidatus Tectomicrobia bacterium]